MAHPTPTPLFFAGTDTDVGKTYTAALVTRMLRRNGHRVGVYKPVASGCQRIDGQLVAEDANALWEAAGQPNTLESVCPQRFVEPLAPPEAAAAEGKTVDAELLYSGAGTWMKEHDVVVVEGAGGLFSPLADGVLNIDLALQLACKTIIVAANRLGVIHQTLATCEAAKHRGLEPSGIILCDPRGDADDSASSNAKQISRYCPVPILATVPHGGGEDDVSGVLAVATQ